MTEGQGRNNNRRRFTQRRKGGNFSTSKSTSNGANKNNNPWKTREVKFHLHDSAQRKTSESFNKIVDAIVTRIQKTFEDSIDIVTSIKNK